MIPFVVDGLAAYRITRLVTRDTLTANLREHALAVIYSGRPAPTMHDSPEVIEFDSLVERVDWERDDAPKLATLLLCPWCVGVWIGFAVMVLRRAMPRVWSPIAEGLALGALAALIEKSEPE